MSVNSVNQMGGVPTPPTPSSAQKMVQSVLTYLSSIKADDFNDSDTRTAINNFLGGFAAIPGKLGDDFRNLMDASDSTAFQTELKSIQGALSQRVSPSAQSFDEALKMAFSEAADGISLAGADPAKLNKYLDLYEGLFTSMDLKDYFPGMGIQIELLLDDLNERLQKPNVDFSQELGDELNNIAQQFIQPY